MLGFGKKKKQTKADKKDAKTAEETQPEAEENKKGKNEPEPQGVPDEKTSDKKKKRLFTKKRLFIVLIVLIIGGAVSFLAYTFFFTAKHTDTQKPIYAKTELPNVHLPEEMLKFSFDYFPDLYAAMVSFNLEMNLFNKEIQRIEAIGQQYPDQKKIADKEKKTWEKAKNSLQKVFLKIEKPIKETYVLFRVNREQGLLQVEARSKELSETAQSALADARELTRKLNSPQTVPQGIFKGTIYKLKKKFL